MDDLLSDFIAETRETLEAIAGEIVAWEADPADRARLDAIFRFVHTVKGSCGFLDLPRLERLSHAAESALADVRAGARAPDRALVDAVLAVIDRIRDLVDAIEGGVVLPDGEDRLLIAALEPGAAPAPSMPAAPGARAVARTIRVPVELLDRMMAGLSDLVLARNELARRVHEAGAGVAAESAVERLSLALGELRETVTRTRMARIGRLFAALPRMVRDLAGELGREVTLVVEGGDVELDREMIEMIRDPLTHIVRNALDHGIEPPAERIASGKPRAGRLVVAARQAGNRIVIEVSDDGRGIDAERLVARAVAAGIVTPAQADAMPPARRLELIFAPGLSTARAVTRISGRGVGMDVVRDNVERIGGVVEIDSRPGEGLRLALRVPLTLTIIPALMVTTGGETFAIPLSAIEEIVRVPADGVPAGGLAADGVEGADGVPAGGRAGVAQIEHVAGACIATIRARRLPVVDLARLLGRPEADGLALLVVLKPAGAPRFALGVAGVRDHQELVVKPAAPAIVATGLYAGVTLPDDDRPMLLLDVAGIAAAAGLPATAPGAEEAEGAATPPAVTFPALLFRARDGAERAVRLALVERIEDVAATAVSFAAGRHWLGLGDRVLPLFGAEEPEAGTRLRVVHLSDGDTALAYAIDAVIDIVAIGGDVAPAAVPGPVAGVVRLDGRTIELVDPHWLFAQAPPGAPGGRRPLALLLDDPEAAGSAWAREVLRPLVEAAGYVVAFAGEAGAGARRADVVLARVGADVAACRDAPADAPVVRLRDERADGDDPASVWRYDRAALTAALAGALGRRRGGVRA